MLKRLTVLALIVVACCAFGITLGRAISAARPNAPDPLLAAFVHDAQMIDGVWCWRDICPEKTSIGEAESLAKRFTSGAISLYPDQSGSFFWNVNGVRRALITVYSIDFNRTVDRVLLYMRPEHVSLGDVLNKIGQPMRLHCNWNHYAQRWEIYLRVDTLNITVYSGNGDLRPTLAVQHINFERLALSAGGPGFRWAGFQNIPGQHSCYVT